APHKRRYLATGQNREVVMRVLQARNIRLYALAVHRHSTHLASGIVEIEGGHPHRISLVVHLRPGGVFGPGGVPYDVTISVDDERTARQARARAGDDEARLALAGLADLSGNRRRLRVDPRGTQRVRVAFAGGSSASCANVERVVFRLFETEQQSPIVRLRQID